MTERNDLFMLRNKDASFQVKMEAFDRLVTLLEKNDEHAASKLTTFVQEQDEGYALWKGQGLMNAIAKAAQVNEKH